MRFSQHILAGYKLVPAVKSMWHLTASLWVLQRQKHSGHLQIEVCPGAGWYLREPALTVAGRSSWCWKVECIRDHGERTQSVHNAGGHQGANVGTCLAGSELCSERCDLCGWWRVSRGSWWWLTRAFLLLVDRMSQLHPSAAAARCHCPLRVWDQRLPASL